MTGLRGVDQTPGVDLDEARRLTEAATPGPWEACGDWAVTSPECNICGTQHLCSIHDGGRTSRRPAIADAEFIAAARTLVPALISEIEQLRELLASYGEPETTKADIRQEASEGQSPVTPDGPATRSAPNT